jgi:hypothetical protein
MQAEFTRIGARWNEVRPAEGGKEVVERFLVGEVRNREREIRFQAVAMENVIDARPNVKDVAGCDPRRILVVILGAESRNHYPRCSELAERASRTDRRSRSSKRAAAVKAHLRLFVARQCQCGGVGRNGAGDLTTVIAPGERGPRPTFFVLILHIGGRAERFIVVNAERAGVQR